MNEMKAAFLLQLAAIYDGTGSCLNIIVPDQLPTDKIIALPVVCLLLCIYQKSV